VEGRVSSWFMVGGYGLYSLGELLVSGLGLAMIARYVPARMSGFMMGAYYVATGVSQCPGSVVANLARVPAGNLDPLQSLPMYTQLSSVSAGSRRAGRSSLWCCCRCWTSCRANINVASMPPATTMNASRPASRCQRPDRVVRVGVKFHLHPASHFSYNLLLQTRGGAVWQLVGLITRRS
jgi:hypothetical protein